MGAALALSPPVRAMLERPSGLGESPALYRLRLQVMGADRGATCSCTSRPFVPFLDGLGSYLE